MKYQTYPAYKDSGVEWLGYVPEHWDARQLKFLCTCNDEVLSDSVNPDYEIEYVDIGSVSAIEGIKQTESMIFSNAPSRARRIVRDGDVIVSTVRTYLEAITPIDNPPENLIVSTGFAVIRPNKFLQKGYAAYCLRANGFIKEVVARSVGISYPAINASDLVNIKTPEPSLDEQQKIAQFLDHETAKIDTLIEKQQRLIELLKEKRQAVISHAVTKGLNPNAPMKESGVAWLGDVPVGWETIRVRHCCQIDNNLRTPIDIQMRMEIFGDYPYYGPTGILNMIDKFNVEGQYFLIGEDGDHFLKFREKSMTIYVEGRFNVNNHAHLMKGTDSCLTKWACLYFEHMDLFPWLIKQGVARYKLRKEMLSDIPVLVPALTEQHEIIRYIDEQKVAFLNLIELANNTINLLQERRTALISAAVTGKIDVRDWGD